MADPPVQPLERGAGDPYILLPVATSLATKVFTRRHKLVWPSGRFSNCTPALFLPSCGAVQEIRPCLRLAGPSESIPGPPGLGDPHRHPGDPAPSWPGPPTGTRSYAPGFCRGESWPWDGLAQAGGLAHPGDLPPRHTDRPRADGDGEPRKTGPGRPGAGGEGSVMVGRPVVPMDRTSHPARAATPHAPGPGESRR